MSMLTVKVVTMIGLAGLSGGRAHEANTPFASRRELGYKISLEEMIHYLRPCLFGTCPERQPLKRLFGSAF
jgi:hypothetical protein